MDNLAILVSSLALTAVLPISVGALFTVIARHLQLSPSASMDSATLDRFDSEAERDAFHADLRAAQETRAAAVMARYRHIMDIELGAIDPRRAEAFRRSLASAPSRGAADLPMVAAAAAREVPDGPLAADATVPVALHGPSPRGLRKAPWRGEQAAPRGNGQSD